KWYLQSQTVWLPRLLNCIQGCYCIPSPKGEGFTDPLTGTLNLIPHGTHAVPDPWMTAAHGNQKTRHPVGLAG
ncbi:MAG: hypothetical protein ABJO27_11650, partial [Pseudoruegeria sp.]